MVSRDVEDAVRIDLALLFVDEVVHLHLLGLAGRAQFAAAILEIPNQFLLLGIDRHDRLAVGQPLFDQSVDVFELCISIRMVRALFVLRVPLKAEAQIFEKPADQFRARLEPHPGECVREILPASAHVTQRRLGVAACGTLGQLAQRIQQARLLGCFAFAPAARLSHPPWHRIRALRQLRNAAPNSSFRHASGPGHGSRSTVSHGFRLGRRHQPLMALVKPRKNLAKLLT